MLNLGSPRTELAPAIVELARDLLLRDRRYVERLKRHYALMRAKVDRPAAAGAPATVAKRKRVGRNEPCPCGSGRKFKRCCGRDIEVRRAAEGELGATAGEAELGPPEAARPTAQWVNEIAIGREVDHIIESAADGVERVVRLGSLALFSTSEGDAWILDHELGSALPLADAGVRLPGRIVESERTFKIEWTHDFHEVEDGVLFIHCFTEETSLLTGALAREVLRT